MSNLRGMALKFHVEGGIAVPVDRNLHRLAVAFADKYLNAPCNFTDYQVIKVVAVVDGEGNPVEVQAINARLPRWDFPIWRFTTPEAGKVLIESTRTSLDDEGLRGGEVFIHITDSEKPESRCPNWREFLKSVGAENASRWRVKI